MNHEYSTRAMVFMMFLFVAGAVIAAIGGGGTPNYIVKWNTSDSITDSIMVEDVNLVQINVSGRLQVDDKTLITQDAGATELKIQNTAVTGDPVIKWALSTTKMSCGIDDSVTSPADPFVCNYGDGISTTPEFMITADDVLIPADGGGGASFVFDNNVEVSVGLGCDTTPSVDETNYLTLPTTVCDVQELDDLHEGQLVVIMCKRPNLGVTVKVSDVFRKIELDGGVDFVCDSVGDTLTVFGGPGGVAYELSRSDN